MLTLVNIGLLVTFLSVSQTFAQNATIGCVQQNCVTEKSSSSSTVGIAVGVSLACLVVIAVVVGVVVYWKRVQFVTCVRQRFQNPFKRAARSQDLNTNNTIPSGHYDKPDQHNTMPSGHYDKPDQHNTMPSGQYDKPKKHNDKPNGQHKDPNKEIPTTRNGNKTEVKDVEVRPTSDPYYEAIDLTKFNQQSYTYDVPPAVDNKNREKNIAHDSEIIDIYEN